MSEIVASEKAVGPTKVSVKKMAGLALGRTVDSWTVPNGPAFVQLSPIYIKNVLEIVNKNVLLFKDCLPTYVL